MLVKLLSWNIWGGRYLDDVIAFLKMSNADIIGLQEVIEFQSSKNMAEEIAEQLGYECVFYKAGTIDKNGKSYNLGNAILSKFPFQKSRYRFLKGKFTQNSIS